MNMEAREDLKREDGLSCNICGGEFVSVDNCANCDNRMCPGCGFWFDDDDAMRRQCEECHKEDEEDEESGLFQQIYSSWW